MRLIINANYFTLGQKIEIIDSDGKNIFSTICSIPDIENVVESLCNQYSISRIYLNGAKSFTQKIANNLSTRTSFDKFNIEIIMV